MSSGLANQLRPSEGIQKPHSIEAQAFCKQMMAFRRKLRTDRYPQNDIHESCKYMTDTPPTSLPSLDFI